MRKSLIIAVLVSALSFQPAFASDWTPTEIPQAAEVGSGRMQYLFFDVYDAVLLAPEGKWDAAKPYALTLNYLRELKGADIAQRSVEEMRMQGFTDEVKLAAWFEQMRAIFPDVNAGMSLTGVYLPGNETRFYKGDQFIGRVKDDQFGQQFFNIWLSEKTSEPGLRQKLLGQHARKL